MESKSSSQSPLSESNQIKPKKRSLVDEFDESPPPPRNSNQDDEGFAHASGKWHSASYLDPGALSTLIVGILLTGIFYGSILLFEGRVDYPVVDRIINMFLRPSNYIVIIPACVFFFWSMATLALKRTSLKKQRKALGFALIPRDQNFVLNAVTAKDVLTRLERTTKNADDFLLLRRIRISLSNLNNLGQVSDVSEVLRGEADEDEARLDNSFSLIYSFVWAIPVLGFIGTAIGLSLAIGSFSAVLGSIGEIEELQSALGAVTSGLGTAFETTLIGLFLALLLHVTSSLEENEERRFLNDCSIYCQEKIVSRLKIENSVEN